MEFWRTEHEPPEAIEAFLAERVEYLVSRDLGDGWERRHHLTLLRQLCRAAQHGRLPDALRQHYDGILRHLRPQIAKAAAAGDRIPPVILDELARVAATRKHKRPGRAKPRSNADEELP